MLWKSTLTIKNLWQTQSSEQPETDCRQIKKIERNPRLEDERKKQLIRNIRKKIDFQERGLFDEISRTTRSKLI